MKSCYLFGLLIILISTTLAPGCTTKFKDPEDADADFVPDTLADQDIPLEGEGNPDLPVDGEDSDGEPARTLVLEPGSSVTRPLTAEAPFVCGMGIPTLRALVSSGHLYLLTTYTVYPPTDPGNEYDCAGALSFSLPDMGETDRQDICGEADTLIYGDGWVGTGVLEDDMYLYIFEAVNDQSGGMPGLGNVRGYRFRKENLNDEGTGFVFRDPWGVVEEAPPGLFSDLFVARCGDRVHVVVRAGEDSPGAPSDYYGFTLHNDDANHELDSMFDEGATRDFAEAGHFIDSTLPTPETARSIFITGGSCREGTLVLAGQEFRTDGSISSLVLNFESELVRRDQHNWTEIMICTSEACTSDGEPELEGMPMVHVDRPAAMDMLFAAWISNEAPFATIDPPPSRVHAGGLVLGTRVNADYTSEPVTRPDEPDAALQPFPPTFDCSSFRPHHARIMYDSVRDVLLISAVVYDSRPDAGVIEALVGIWALDGERRPLAPPFFLGTGLPIMLGYEAVLDEDSGILYLVWSAYDAAGVNLSEGIVDVIVHEAVITPVTYRDAD
jgi:hypothetical protein